MGMKKVYSEEVKLEVIHLKLKGGYSNREIMDMYGIKNVTQIKRWMQWYRDGQQYRLAQGIGKPYGVKNGSQNLSEVDQLKRQVKHLKAQLKILKKYQVIQRSWFHKL